MRIVIGGSRNYNNYEYFAETLDHLLCDVAKNEITIISGHCKGVDLMAECYAKERGISLELYPADWDAYGRAAGPMRNKIMVENCDLVIAFWDGSSKGARSLIDYAIKQGRSHKIIGVN